MTRCESCHGIMKKSEPACYVCGEKNPAGASPGGYTWLTLAVLVSIGFTAYTFLMRH